MTFNQQSEEFLKFFIFIVKELYPQALSLAKIKSIELPGFISPQKVIFPICSSILHLSLPTVVLQL